MWNPGEHSDEENLRWCLLRAAEWGSWPVFISQPIAPLALLLCPWWVVILATIGANALWALFVRYKVVDPALAFLGAIFVRLKWITCPVSAYVLWHRDMRAVATMALLWPLLVLVMPNWSAQIGTIQKMFMGCLGYQRTGMS